MLTFYLKVCNSNPALATSFPCFWIFTRTSTFRSPQICYKTPHSATISQCSESTWILLLSSHKLTLKASPFKDCNAYFFYVWYEVWILYQCYFSGLLILTDKRKLMWQKMNFFSIFICAFFNVFFFQNYFLEYEHNTQKSFKLAFLVLITLNQIFIFLFAGLSCITEVEAARVIWGCSITRHKLWYISLQNSIR